MTFPKVRLAVSACLFVAWIGFLLFLVVDSRTIVLSKPQFMIAQLYAVVEVRDQGGKADPDVTVEEVLWTADKADQQLAGQALHLAELPVCTKEQGYQGAGKYLVPLIKANGAGFLIAPYPRVDSKIHIYSWTPDTRAQVEHLVVQKK